MARLLLDFIQQCAVTLHRRELWQAAGQQFLLFLLIFESHRWNMKIIKSFVLLVGLCVAGLTQAEGHLKVEDAWVREAPPGAMVLAGYMQLHNHADKNRLLVAAQSPAFESVMLHKTVIEGEISKMVHQPMITIPANGLVSFEPNSYHLMMMKPQQPLKAGDKVSVTLSFKDGSSEEFSYEVRATMGGMGTDHSDHNMGHQH